MVDRAGHRLLEAQLIALRGQLEWVLRNPRLRAKVVVDGPGANSDGLDDAAAAAIGHLEAARVVLAPFFWQDYAVGDVVDVVEVSEQTGQERVELAGVTVVEIRGQGFTANAVVEDGQGNRHLVAGSAVQKRDDDL